MPPKNVVKASSPGKTSVSKDAKKKAADEAYKNTLAMLGTNDGEKQKDADEETLVEEPTDAKSTEEGTAPEGTAPESTAPESTAPEGTQTTATEGEGAPADKTDGKKDDGEAKPASDEAKDGAKPGPNKVTKKTNKKKKPAPTIFDKTHKAEKASVEERDYLAWRNSVMTNKEMAAVRQIDKLMDRAVLEARNHRNKTAIENIKKKRVAEEKDEKRKAKNRKNRDRYMEKHPEKFPKFHKDKEEKAKKEVADAVAKVASATAEKEDASAAGKDASKAVEKEDTTMGDAPAPVSPTKAVTRSQAASASASA